jgi:hypothetical protein
MKLHAGCALLCLVASVANVAWADAKHPKHKRLPPPPAAKVVPDDIAPSEAAAAAPTLAAPDAPPPLAAPPSDAPHPVPPRDAQHAPSPDTQHAAPPPPDAKPAVAAPSDKEPDKSTLPAGHEPTLTLKVDPRVGVKTGQLVHLEIGASAPVGDDVTIGEQSFAPFEVQNKQARVEPPKDGKQRFVFNLDLLALEPGDKPIPAVELRVVTKENFVGAAHTATVPFKVLSLIANEPNAQPKLETKPVAVLEDNYIPIYVLGGLAAAAAIAGLTLLGARYWRRRKLAAIPPPPPRPPWEIAAEKLAWLREQKQPMLEAGQGGLFVDQLSDVVRSYLGGRFVFDGLETTSDEMLTQLKLRGASLGFTQEVGQFLGRCDLVKFAKVEPDANEVDLLFAKAQDLVHLSEPTPPAAGAPATSPPADPIQPQQNEGGSRP